jgi:hypothetical protein
MPVRAASAVQRAWGINQMVESTNPVAAPAIVAPVSLGAQWLSKNLPEMRRAQLGLWLILIGICAMLLGMAVYVVIPLRALGMVIHLDPALCLLGTGYVLQAIGPSLCLDVPAASGAKPLVITTVVLMALALAMSATKYLASMHSPDSGNFSYLLGGLVAFVLSLRQLALFIERPDLARRAVAVLVVAAGIAFASVGLNAMTVSGLFSSHPQVFVQALSVVTLVDLILYASLINSLRRALRP